MGMSAHQRIRRAMEEKRKAAAEQAQLETPVDIDKMQVSNLKEYAKVKGIDITGLTKKEEIRLRILEFIKGSGENGGQPDGGDANGGAAQTNDDAPDGEGAAENGAV